MSGEDGNKRNKDKAWPSPNKPYEDNKEENMKIWGIFLFGIIGATATTFAVSLCYKFQFLFPFVFNLIHYLVN